MLIVCCYSIYIQHMLLCILYSIYYLYIGTVCWRIPQHRVKYFMYREILRDVFAVTTSWQDYACNFVSWRNWKCRYGNCTDETKSFKRKLSNSFILYLSSNIYWRVSGRKLTNLYVSSNILSGAFNVFLKLAGWFTGNLAKDHCLYRKDRFHAVHTDLT